MNTEHPLDRAAEAVDGIEALARRLKVTPQAVSNWKTRGTPAQYCARIAEMSNGAVTRQELRPNDWRDFWPELDTSKRPKRTASRA